LLKLFKVETENTIAPFLFLDKKPASCEKEIVQNSINIMILNKFKFCP